VAQGAVKAMMAEGIAGGSLIHIGSQMGHVGGPNRSSTAPANGRSKA
jgi:hypothetical protein